MHVCVTKRVYVSHEVKCVNSRLQEAHYLLTFLLGLVGHDGSIHLSLHIPQTHHCLGYDDGSEGDNSFITTSNIRYGTHA